MIQGLYVPDGYMMWVDVTYEPVKEDSGKLTIIKRRLINIKHQRSGCWTRFEEILGLDLQNTIDVAVRQLADYVQRTEAARSCNTQRHSNDNTEGSF